MKRLLPVLAILLFGFSSFCYAADDDEISLFDSMGTATAYIAEELTIYLWSGKPIAKEGRPLYTSEKAFEHNF